MTNTNNTQPLSFSPPTDTLQGYDMSATDFETMWRSTIGLICRLYYIRHGKRPGYRVKISFQEVEEDK